MKNSGQLESETIVNIPIKRSECEIKVSGIADSGYALRSNWIGKWVDPVSQSFRASLGSGHISLGSGAFEVLIVHGDDLDELKHLVAETRSMYLTTVIVAVQSRSGPTSRAALLYAGADTVWDVMQWPQEAAASLRSAVNRQKMADPTLRSISAAR